MSYVNVIHEVKRCEVENEWVLCFQYCSISMMIILLKQGIDLFGENLMELYNLQEDKLESLKCQIYFI